MSAYEVDDSWETHLEPGTWYRIVDADKPRLIHGYVFMPPGGSPDYRDTLGSPLSKRNEQHRAMVPQWDAAIIRWHQRKLEERDR